MTTITQAYDHLSNIASVSMEEASDLAASYMRAFNIMIASSSDSDAAYKANLRRLFLSLETEGLQARKHHRDSK